MVTDKQILQCLATHSGQTAAQITAALGRSAGEEGVVRSRLDGLCHKGQVLEDRSTWPRAYSLGEVPVRVVSEVQSRPKSRGAAPASVESEIELRPAEDLPPGGSKSEQQAVRTFQRSLEKEGWRVKVFPRTGTVQANRGAKKWYIHWAYAFTGASRLESRFSHALNRALHQMSEPKALYSIGMRDLPEFRSAWMELPLLAKTRTGLTAVFVTESGEIEICAK